jgi:hypothetical protein
MSEKHSTADVVLQEVAAVAANTGEQKDATFKQKEEERKPVPQAGTPVHTDWDKKIIKTAHITLDLENYNAFNENIHKGLKAYGAYIASENQTNSDYRMNNVVVIKVPVDQFDNLLNNLPGKGIKVVEKNISTEDVTGEVVDIKSRLEAKKQVREQYLGLLKQARNMKDILAVQEEINSIQEEIESASGRADYLVHQAAYSTVHLTYYQLLNGFSETETTPSFFKRMKTAFRESFEVIGNLLLFVIYCWPLLLGLAAAFILYKKRKQLRLRKSI